MSDGWVSLFRSLLTSDVFADAQVLKVFIWCLLRANHSARAVTTTTGRGSTVVQLAPGQFIFGAHAAAEQLAMPKTSVQRRIEKLVAMGTIKIDSGSHYSIVTVCNWETYQNNDNESGQATGNQRVGNGQPMGTNNNKNNNNNISSRPALRFGPGDRELAEHIWGKVHALQPSRKAPNLERWANDIRLARETDGRSLTDLRDLFDRAHADAFWQANILSPAKLREKFDDLDLKLRKQPNHARSNSAGSSPARVRSGEYSDPALFQSASAAVSS